MLSWWIYRLSIVAQRRNHWIEEVHSVPPVFLSVVIHIPVLERDILPELDNVLLSHDDRSRIIPSEHHQRVMDEYYARGAVLVDGFVAGFWYVQRHDDGATLLIEPFEPLSK